MSTRPGPTSRVERLYRALDPDGQEVMRMIVSDTETSARLVAKALSEMAAEHGIDVISAQTIKQLRLGQLLAWRDIAR